MPRPCWPLCVEKRDFMDHDPPTKAEHFYKSYDPMVGIGTAAVLFLFFFIITIRSLVRWAIEKVQFNNFEKKRRKNDAANGQRRPILVANV